MTITSSQTGGLTAAIFLLLRRSRFVQSVAGLRRNSQWLLSTMADRFETTAIGVYAVALRGRAALRLLTLAGGSGAGTVFLRNCPRPIFFANSDRCAA